MNLDPQEGWRLLQIVVTDYGPVPNAHRRRVARALARRARRAARRARRRK